MNGKPRLLDQVRKRIRFLHYSIRTEEAYIGWIRRFILFHGKRHPQEVGAPEVEAFLSDLATQGRVTASTQNQALSAILFLYRQALGIDPGGQWCVNSTTVYDLGAECGGGDVRILLGRPERLRRCVRHPLSPDAGDHRLHTTPTL